MGSGCDEERKAKKRKRASNISINSELPWHVIQRIFAELPIVKLPSCRLVCKDWHDMVLDYASTFKFNVPNSFFVSLQYDKNLTQPIERGSVNDLKLYCIDFDAEQADGLDFVASIKFDSDWSNFRIVNSCNGLLCLIAGTRRRRCYAINPMTNEYMKLGGDSNKNIDTVSYFFGLCFSLKTKQYKLVGVFFHISSCFSCITHRTLEIFTLGHGSEWRCVDFTPFNFCKGYGGVSYNGALYWVGADSNQTAMLCRIGVEDEKFQVVPLPKVDLIRAYWVDIGVFNGRFYATLRDRRKQDYWTEVWMMRSHGGEDSWIREFVIEGLPERLVAEDRVVGRFQFIKVCEDGEILCLVEQCYLFLYNPKNGNMKRFLQSEGGRRSFSVYQIESPKFDSLEKIIAGDGCYS